MTVEEVRMWLTLLLLGGTSFQVARWGLMQPWASASARRQSMILLYMGAAAAFTFFAGVLTRSCVGG